MTRGFCRADCFGAGGAIQVSSEWKVSDNNQRVKVYRLTEEIRDHLRSPITTVTSARVLALEAMGTHSFSVSSASRANHAVRF
jgi:hypothetical protein